MRHRVKKIKFGQGRDANRMLVRKLAKNFITNSRIETTLKKTKVLKSVIERLVEKSKIESEANKNYLIKELNDENLVKRMYKEVGSVFKNKVGGYVRIIRLGIVRADGSETARLEWTQPIISLNTQASPTKLNKKQSGNEADLATKVVKTTK